MHFVRPNNLFSLHPFSNIPCFAYQNVVLSWPEQESFENSIYAFKLHALWFWFNAHLARHFMPFQTEFQMNQKTYGKFRKEYDIYIQTIGLRHFPYQVTVIEWKLSISWKEQVEKAFELKFESKIYALGKKCIVTNIIASKGNIRQKAGSWIIIRV